MNDRKDIFKLFCKYVDDTIFKENIGSVVSFVIDQSYIDSFCEKYSIGESELLDEVRKNMYRYNASIDHVKGIIAIQVYAATKRADDYIMTSANYRGRLADLLSWDTAMLQSWMHDFQDSYWKRLYSWCDENHYEISKSAPYSGKGRYVQYPLQQAKRVFTKDELLYIACAFVDNNLYPDDDITFDEFWRVVLWRSLSRYIQTNHALNLYSTREFYDDARKQIFNYFLRWNGEYKQFSKIRNIRPESKKDLFVYMSDEYDSIDIRNDKLELVTKFQLSTFSHNTYTSSKSVLPIRRKDLILFKRDAFYNIWQETRFLEGDEEGVAIIFSEFTSRWIHFPKSDLIKYTAYAKIFKVSKGRWSYDLYEELRNYKLEGGLRIGRRMYLLGGAPLFYINTDGLFWIDDEAYSSTGDYLSLNHLGVGIHQIKVVGYKDIIFEIIDSPLNVPLWSIDNSQWCIDKKSVIWKPAKMQNGVVGMNLSNICQTKYIQGDEMPTLCAWARVHQAMTANSQNMIVKTLKNINDYE